MLSPTLFKRGRRLACLPNLDDLAARTDAFSAKPGFAKEGLRIFGNGR
jgi:hypothetical protein